MIGNDVVDFEQALIDGAYNRPRFLDKAFNLDEKNQILDSIDSHKQACIFWAVKEAAYKSYFRETGNRFLNPKRIKLHLKHYQNKPTVVVTIESSKYFVRINLNTNHVVATAQSINAPPKSFYNQLILLPNERYGVQSVYIKEAVIDFFSAYLNRSKRYLKILKDKHGIPYLFVDDTKKEYLISLSHHGRRAAYLVGI
ncbi:4'-phosphopantetheinyl transferase superfamily protein [Spongiivirga sp. MCCC 1A20706]|uniref:4'-phosphopantetheinyl transferase family protein n=1 Tax=Spongiivirga sp. MCCC 1A20706 TaxID=3160963 RepID=UPI0039777F8F